jgi:hypothetical protein
VAEGEPLRLAVALGVPLPVPLPVAHTEGLRLGLAVCEGVPLFVPLLLRVSEGVAVGVHVPLRVPMGLPLGDREAVGDTVCVGDHDEPSGSSGGSEGQGVPCGAAEAVAAAVAAALPPPSEIVQLRPKGPATAVRASTTRSSVAGSGGANSSALARQASTVVKVTSGAQ